MLTAAHVVYDEGRKKIAERITVYSGLYGNIIRGSAKGIKTYVLKGYTSTLDSKYDLAAIKLDTNLGSLTGSLGITSTIALGDKIATAGYPDDKTDRTNSSDLKYYIWRSTGKIMNLDKYRVYYDADTKVVVVYGMLKATSLWQFIQTEVKHLILEQGLLHNI
ncbi:trypsin-like serine peptidase [Staphylococcus pseudintermedius]|uniref:trypsin-like serine peptidase n=1 Tax=Staphylococcus pseudintermedius TaxID=283734 RepID=UPI001F53F8D8|nr:trypsin-like serine protease [Staphylococcus pseudintermedius]